MCLSIDRDALNPNIGKPTAYIESGRAQFHYPPTWETFEATIREVNASLNRLGSYVLKDFLQQRTVNRSG